MYYGCTRQPRNSSQSDSARVSVVEHSSLLHKTVRIIVYVNVSVATGSFIMWRMVYVDKNVIALFSSVWEMHVVLLYGYLRL